MQRTPGFYSDIKVNLQRSKRPAQDHKIVLVTSDETKELAPVPVYDTADADAKSVPRSNAGRMMAAALSLSQSVDVEMLGLNDDVPPPIEGEVTCHPSQIVFTDPRHEYVLHQALGIPKSLIFYNSILHAKTEAEFMDGLISGLADLVNLQARYVDERFDRVGARAHHGTEDFGGLISSVYDRKYLFNMSVSSQFSSIETQSYTIRLKGDEVEIKASDVNSEEWLKSELPVHIAKVLEAQHIWLANKMDLSRFRFFEMAKGYQQVVIPLVDPYLIKDAFEQRFEESVLTLNIKMGAALLINEEFVVSTEGKIGASYAAYSKHYFKKRLTERPDITGVGTADAMRQLRFEKMLTKKYISSSLDEWHEVVFKDKVLADTESNMGVIQ